MENKGTAKIREEDAEVFVSGIVYSSYKLDDEVMTSADAGRPNEMDLEGAYIEGDRTIPGDFEVAQWIELEYIPDVTSGTITGAGPAETYTTADGLPSNSVMSIAIDQDGIT